MLYYIEQFRSFKSNITGAKYQQGRYTNYSWVIENDPLFKMLPELKPGDLIYVTHNQIQWTRFEQMLFYLNFTDDIRVDITTYWYNAYFPYGCYFILRNETTIFATKHNLKIGDVVYNDKNRNDWMILKQTHCVIYKDSIVCYTYSTSSIGNIDRNGITNTNT